MNLPIAAGYRREHRATSEVAIPEPWPPRSMRVGVIRNPRSHGNRDREAEPAATARVPDTVSLVTPRSLAELSAALRGFAEDRVDVIAIDGGDGTVRDVLTCGAALFGDRWPRLLLVPKGKTNALAIDLGIPTHWPLAEGLRAGRAARTVVRRPILIERDNDSPIMGFFFGAGAFNAAIATGQTAHRFGAFQGFAVVCTAAMGVTQAVFGFGNSPWRHSARMRITDGGGGELPHSARGPRDRRYLALLSTLRRFPAGIAPFAPADADIRFLLLDAPLRRVTARLPAILWGGSRSFYRSIGVHRGGGATFDFDLDEGFILDGEAFPPDRIRLRQGPELHFIVP